MIFEDAYKKWITDKINTELRAINNRLTVKSHMDISYKPLMESDTQVALLLQGGNAARSESIGVDKNVMPLSISLVCKNDYTAQVRNAVENVQRVCNAVPMTLQYSDGADGTVQSVGMINVFNTPYLMEETDWKSKNATIKASFLQMSVTVIYGQNAYISPPKTYINIDGTDYEIKHIIDTNLAYAPVYDEYQASGSTTMWRNLIAHTSAFSFTVQKVVGDSLQSLFEQEIMHASHPLSEAAELKLTVDNLTITITKIGQIVETFAGNDAAYNITLAR